ncbi:Protein shisa-6 like protein [Tupaia chinensis]|uniref:Protein shisa-6 like protein n=1 Tax=Tupaia chinensis TaxID=246437 RepID=L9JRX1_TUPCH|nr:Protein shisa-6 like protein [Tupaia chinensis]
MKSCQGSWCLWFYYLAAQLFLLESGYLYCCGTCYYRFCCKKRHEKLDQRQCTNYQSPVWVQTPSTKVVSPGPENKYDPEKDKTNFTVYITCGVIAFVIVAGVFAKVSYDKAHRPPREMNIHRALADILRQQGPIPIAHCERETISAIDTSPKENTPVRSSSKNHYTPVRTAKQTPGLPEEQMCLKAEPSRAAFALAGLPVPSVSSQPRASSCRELQRLGQLSQREAVPAPLTKEVA